jgi:hypothetical protein
MSEPINLDIKPADGGNTEQIREKKQTLNATAEIMDMSIPLPIEENVIDYSDQVKETPVETKIEEAKVANTQTISDKKAATLAKARAAKSEKAKINRLTGKSMAQGSKAPDLVTELAKLLDKRFADVNKRFDDLTVYLPHQAPLQDIGVPNINNKRYREQSKFNPANQIELDQADEYGNIPINNNGSYVDNRAYKMSRTNMNSTSKAAENFEARNRNQARVFQYENDQTEARAMKDVTMGGKPATKTQYIMF